MKARVHAFLALALSAAFLPAIAGGQVTGRQTVTGQVVDSLTGLPLSGARIVSPSGIVLTDAGGHFTIEVASADALIQINSIGYRGVEIAARSLGSSVLMAREPVLLTGLVVTAAPSPHLLAEGSALGHLTVPRSQIASRGETDLADALKSVEGVSVQHPGTWGAKAFLRGLGGERVTFLVDGDRLNRACNFGMDAGLATLSAANVEKVEVLSGPGSVLYGSGNIGGVVNVVTRAPTTGRGRPFSGELRLGASSAVPGGTMGGSFYASGNRAQLSLAADGAKYGDYSSPVGTVDGSSYRDATLDGRFSLTPAQGHRAEVHVQRYFGRDIGYPATAGASIPSEDRLLTGLDYGWQASHGILDAVSAKVYRQKLDHDMEMSMLMSTGMGGSMTMQTEASSNSVTWGGRAHLRLRPVASSQLDAGGELTQWNAEGTRWMTKASGTPMASTIALRSWPGVKVRDVGTFIQGEWLPVSRLAMNGGVRVDRVHNEAETGTPNSQWVGSGNIGLRMDAGAGLSARASLGYGYRVADPLELYGLAVRPDGFIYTGNPDLQTEHGRNLEAGLSYSHGRFESGVTVYRNDIRDMISPVLVTDSMILGYRVREYRNLLSARVEGFTAQSSVRLPLGFEARVVGNYSSGVDQSSGGALPAIPPLEGTATLRFSTNGALQWAEVESRGATAQNHVATTAGEAVTPGFVILNARASFAVVGTTITAGVDNIFDRSYRNHLDPVRILAVGRNVYLRMRRAF